MGGACCCCGFNLDVCKSEFSGGILTRGMDSMNGFTAYQHVWSRKTRDGEFTKVLFKDCL